MLRRNFLCTQRGGDGALSTDTYFESVQQLRDMGITTMVGPNQNVTRDQMVLFLRKAFLGLN
jgi:hypothetical protein